MFKQIINHILYIIDQRKNLKHVASIIIHSCKNQLSLLRSILLFISVSKGPRIRLKSLYQIEENNQILLSVLIRSVNYLPNSPLQFQRKKDRPIILIYQNTYIQCLIMKFYALENLSHLNNKLNLKYFSCFFLSTVIFYITICYLFLHFFQLFPLVVFSSFYPCISNFFFI